MKDRTPRYPNRVKITHADGTSEYVTWERADSPVEAGTPLNKSTLLTDETAELLGLDDTGTVNDALERVILSAVSETAGRSELDDVLLCGGRISSNGWTSVQFPFRFPRIPSVTATVEIVSTATGIAVALITNVTEEGFQVIVRNTNGATVQATIHYIAFIDGGVAA